MTVQEMQIRLKNFEKLLRELTPIVPLEEARMYAAEVGFDWVFDALIKFRLREKEKP